MVENVACEIFPPFEMLIRKTRFFRAKSAKIVTNEFLNGDQFLLELAISICNIFPISRILDLLF